MTDAWTLRLRGLVFVALAVYLLLLPAVEQVFGVRVKLLPKWQMYAGYGRQVCRVDYRQVLPDGSSTPLDRFEVLGHTTWEGMPRSLWRVHSHGRAVYWGERMCKRVGGEAPDIRVVATCGDRRGWVEVEDGERNLCADLPDRGRRGRGR